MILSQSRPLARRAEPIGEEPVYPALERDRVPREARENLPVRRVERAERRLAHPREFRAGAGEPDFEEVGSHAAPPFARSTASSVARVSRVSSASAAKRG